MRNKRTVLTHVMALSAALLLGACGDRGADKEPGQDEVRAINLDTGETKTFSSSGAVPAGWAPCNDASCAGEAPPASVPCQNIGTDVCEQQLDWRLFELSCTGTAEACPNGATCPTTPAAPPSCEYACIPKLPLLCGELLDETSCAARPDCDWASVGIGACPQIGDCDQKGYRCVDKDPLACDQLSESQCGQRADCRWQPQPCPLCDPMDGACACPAFCQPVASAVPPTEPAS